MYYNQDFNPLDFNTGDYCRKSSDSEERQVQSIPKQKRINEEDARRTGVNFTRRYSESKSAFKRNNRPAFAQMVADTEAGIINAWWCLDPTRLCRNAYEAGIIITLMDEGCLHHVRTKWRIYFNTARDKKSLMDEFTDSKKDSDSKSENVKLGLTERYLKGFPNGIASLGYLNDKTKEKGNRGWVVDQTCLDLIQQLLQEFLSGQYSINSITAYAREQLRLRTPARKKMGGKLVARSYVHKQILLNPIYAGFFFAKDEHGKMVRYDLAPHLPRLISEVQHQRIKAYLGRDNITKRQKYDPVFKEYIFSPYEGAIGADHTLNLICDCKHKFSPRNRKACPKCHTPIKAMKEPKYYAYTHYYNLRRRNTKGVIAKTIRETKVEAFLMDYIENNLKLSQALQAWCLKHLHVLKEEEKLKNSRIKEAQKRSNEDIEQEKKKLREMFRKGMITEEEYSLDLSDLNEQVADIAPQPKEVDWMSRAKEIISISDEFIEIMNFGSSGAKKATLSKLGSNLLWDEQKLSIINAKPVQMLIDTLQKAKAQNPAFEPAKIVDTHSRNGVFSSICPTLLRGLDKLRTQILLEKHAEVAPVNFENSFS